MPRQAPSIGMNESDETNPTRFEARIGLSDTGSLQMPLKWAQPVFTAFDGIGEMADLATAGGQILALGYLATEGLRCVGSGIMVGPGLLLTATHVLDELEGCWRRLKIDHLYRLKIDQAL